MPEAFLSAASLQRWVEALLATHQVIAPVTRNGRCVFRAVRRADEVEWRAARTDLSAKEFFFPASEAIVTWTASAAGTRAEEPGPVGPRAVLALRPCDAHALEVLDRLFLDDPVDPGYQSRRAATVLVGLACVDGPWPGCFCTAMGGGPADRRRLDVLLAAVDGGYAVDAVTEKGRALLASAPLEPLEGRRAPDAPDAGLVPVAPAAAWRSRFDDPWWDGVAERCLGCRVCTYVCPVCHCFDVRDRARAGGGVERLRCWDSCQAAGCFAVAGGHDPRPTKGRRLRQRYMHKFLYYPAREQGAALCVGCGRCVVQCPVNVDVREVLAHVAEGVP